MDVRIKTSFRVADDGTLIMGQCVYVPNNEMVKRKVLQETHDSKFVMHPGSTKMYQDLKPHYWWPNMKREIADYVLKCGICQQVKVEESNCHNLIFTIFFRNFPKKY
jgi:hypothetical protein